MNIVFMAPSGLIGSAVDQLHLEDSDHVFRSISCQATDASIESLIVTPALGRLAHRGELLLSGSVAGRNALRLSPLDRGYRFARAVARSAEAGAWLAASDLIVVLERDGIRAGWDAHRKSVRPENRAVYGIPAAQGILSGD